MKAYLSRVVLIDASHDPQGFVYRVLGRIIAQAQGKKYPAKSVHQLEPGGIFQVRVAPVPRRCAREGAAFTRGHVFVTRKVPRHYRATTPIIDKLLAIWVEYGKFRESISDAKVATVKRTET